MNDTELLEAFYKDIGLLRDRPFYCYAFIEGTDTSADLVIVAHNLNEEGELTGFAYGVHMERDVVSCMGPDVKYSDDWKSLETEMDVRFQRGHRFSDGWGSIKRIQGGRYYIGIQKLFPELIPEYSGVKEQVW
jgi:hypothetical protein